MKVCSRNNCDRAGMLLPDSNFYKSGKRLHSECKQCTDKDNKKYKQLHKDDISSYKKGHYANNREKYLNRAKIRYQNNKNDIIEYVGKYKLTKKKNDLNFRLREYLRARMYKALKGNFKSGSAVHDLGCSIDELRLWLESKFQPGMTWENYGYYGWHIDHITPLSQFDLTNRGQFLKACHYTNLQPLWAKENISKGGKRKE